MIQKLIGTREQGNSIVYKISEEIQDTAPRHLI